MAKGKGARPRDGKEIRDEAESREKMGKEDEWAHRDVPPGAFVDDELILEPERGKRRRKEKRGVIVQGSRGKGQRIHPP